MLGGSCTCIVALAMIGRLDVSGAEEQITSKAGEAEGKGAHAAGTGSSATPNGAEKKNNMKKTKAA